MEEPKRKRWKKILFYILAFLLILIVILFILFCTLIANPFESNYNENLAYLIPKESDAVVYIPDAEKFIADIRATFPVKELQKTMAYRQFTRRRDYKRLQQIWKNLVKQQKQVNFEFLKEEYLWKLIKGEIATSVRWRENKPQWLCVAKIDFLVRIAEGLSPYIVAEKVTKKLGIDLTSTIKKIPVDKQNTLFVSLAHNLIFISNNKDYLQESWRLLANNSASIISLSRTLKTRVQKKNSTITIYVQNEQIKKHIPKKIISKLQAVIDINTVGDTLISLQVHPHISVTGITQLDSTSLSKYHEQLYQIPFRKFSADILPQNVYMKVQLPVDVSIWENAYLHMPRKVKNEVDKRIGLLNKSYNTNDFLKERIFKHLDKQLVVTLATIDYTKQNIDVLDPYPAVCIFAPSQTPEQFYAYLKEILQKEVAKTKGKVKVVEKRYGNQSFLRIDIGGFDITGGAVQPVLAHIGNYVVFSSHVVFLRELINTQDQIAPSWKTSRLYSFVQSAQTLSPVVKFELSGDGVINYVENFQQLWAEEIALARFNRNPRGRKMEHIKAQLLRSWRKHLNYAKSFKVNTLVEVEPSLDEIQWNISADIRFNY